MGSGERPWLSSKRRDVHRLGRRSSLPTVTQASAGRMKDLGYFFSISPLSA